MVTSAVQQELKQLQTQQQETTSAAAAGAKQPQDATAAKGVADQHQGPAPAQSSAAEQPASSAAAQPESQKPAVMPLDATAARVVDTIRPMQGTAVDAAKFTAHQKPSAEHGKGLLPPSNTAQPPQPAHLQRPQLQLQPSQQQLQPPQQQQPQPQLQPQLLPLQQQQLQRAISRRSPSPVPRSLTPETIHEHSSSRSSSPRATAAGTSAFVPFYRIRQMLQQQSDNRERERDAMQPLDNVSARQFSISGLLPPLASARNNLQRRRPPPLHTNPETTVYFPPESDVHVALTSAAHAVGAPLSPDAVVMSTTGLRQFLTGTLDSTAATPRPPPAELLANALSGAFGALPVSTSRPPTGMSFSQMPADQQELLNLLSAHMNDSAMLVSQQEMQGETTLTTITSVHDNRVSATNVNTPGARRPASSRYNVGFITPTGAPELPAGKPSTRYSAGFSILESPGSQPSTSHAVKPPETTAQGGFDDNQDNDDDDDNVAVTEGDLPQTLMMKRRRWLPFAGLWTFLAIKLRKKVHGDSQVYHLVKVQLKVCLCPFS